MTGRLWFYLLLTVLLLPPTLTTATAPAPAQDETIPSNGCVFHNPYNVTIRFKLRNKWTGVWEPKVEEIHGGGTGTYIEKDYVQFEHGSVPLHLDFKRRYEIIWNPYRRGWDIKPG